MGSNWKFFLGISILSLVVFFAVVNSDNTATPIFVGPCSTSCRQANVTSENSSVPKCMCDDKCYRYGDCCFDAPNLHLNVTTYPKCTYVSVNGSFFINRTCTNSFYALKCLKSANYSVQANRARLRIPVTSPSSGITYGNMFCAKCQNVTDYQPWNAMFTCQTYSKIVNVSLSAKKSIFVDNAFPNRFDNATQSWTVINSAANTTEKCTVSPILPDSLKTIVRYCYANMIKTCRSNATTQQIARCQTYQSIVFNASGVPYKNSFCASCNGDEKYDCSYTASTSSKARNLTMQVQTTARASIGRTTTANPLSVRVSTKHKTYLHVSFKLDHFKALTTINFTKVRAEMVYYRTFNRTYVRNSTLIRGTSIRLCRLKNQTTVDLVSSRGNLFSTYYLHFVRLCAAVALLIVCLHLRTYFSSEYAKTCTHKITASCALALCVAYLGTALNEYYGIGGYLWYYGYISSLFWISSMAFDVTLAIWSVNWDFSTALKAWNTDKSPRFTVYSRLSWLSPIAILIMVLIWHADLASWDSVIIRSYDEDITFLVFFVLPLTMTMSISLGFYICSMYVVYTEPETTDKLSKLGIKYGLHSGIVLTTNFMWTFMAIADYTQYVLFQYVFSFFEVVLAILIYVASPGVNDFSKKKNFER